MADTESEATYQDLFRSLKARGLSGVVLVISNEHEGLKAAISRHFQGASQQRFQVHYSRNLLGVVWATEGRAYPLGQLSWSQAIARVACIVGCKRTAYIGSSILSNRERCLLGR